jgi:hypothetical protein
MPGQKFAIQPIAIILLKETINIKTLQCIEYAFYAIRFRCIAHLVVWQVFR